VPFKLKSAVTNADGRLDVPLLEGADCQVGTYEIRFFAGDYLQKHGATGGAFPFLDLIPIRFGLADASQHYHVPLLLSAHGYATYRGS
jgi:5-hydroxyisourate hydrolase